MRELRERLLGPGDHRMDLVPALSGQTQDPRPPELQVRRPTVRPPNAPTQRPHRHVVRGPEPGSPLLGRLFALPLGKLPIGRLRGKRLMGLEPTTFCMASRRSSQLSYSRAGAEYTGTVQRLGAGRRAGPGEPDQAASRAWLTRASAAALCSRRTWRMVQDSNGSRAWWTWVWSSRMVASLT